MFLDRSFLERCFRGLALPVLEYCFAVWCSAADNHLKLLDRAVSGSRFLTGSVFQYDVSHRRSVAVLYMLYKIRCNPMHPLNDALRGPHVAVRVTRGALVAHQYTSLSVTSLQNLAVQQDFCSPLSVPGTILLTPYSMVWDWCVSRAGPMLFYWPKLLYPYYSLVLFFPFSSSFL